MGGRVWGWGVQVGRRWGGGGGEGVWRVEGWRVVSTGSLSV